MPVNAARTYSESRSASVMVRFPSVVMGMGWRMDGDVRGSLRLAEFLIGLLALVELGGEGLGGPGAQGLLDESAGLAALAAGKATGLDPGLAGRADGDL